MAPLMASYSYPCELEEGRYGKCFSKVAIGGEVQDVVVIEFNTFTLYFPLSEFNDEGRTLIQKYYFYGWNGEFHRLFDLQIHHLTTSGDQEIYDIHLDIRSNYRSDSL